MLLIHWLTGGHCLPTEFKGVRGLLLSQLQTIGHPALQALENTISSMGFNSKINFKRNVQPFYFIILLYALIVLLCGTLGSTANSLNGQHLRVLASEVRNIYAKFSKAIFQCIITYLAIIWRRILYIYNVLQLLYTIIQAIIQRLLYIYVQQLYFFTVNILVYVYTTNNLIT